jgi:hypothetical protein
MNNTLGVSTKLSTSEQLRVLGRQMHTKAAQVANVPSSWLSYYAGEVDMIRSLLTTKPSTFARVSGQETNMIGQPEAPTNLPTPPPPGPALAETKGGLKQIVAAGVNYVNLMLGNMYWIAPGEGQPVLQIDGAWTFIAVTAQQFEQLIGMTPSDDLNAYGAIAGRSAGSYALVDVQAVAKNLEGGAIQPVTFMVVKDRTLAAQITNDPNSTMAVLAPLDGAASEKPKKKTAPILIAAGVGLAVSIVGGPAVGLAAGGVTYLVAS